MLAEEYLNGTGSAAAYSFQAGSGYSVDYNASPGNANAPVIFEAPVEIAGALETWLAASGGPNWGGCEVWISEDGDTYKLAGRISGPCRQGELSANLPSGSDPDTVNTLSVDLSQSQGQLLSGTQADADSYNTLCYADGELVSYQTATLTAQYGYDLTYLRRGLYGTAVGAHTSGTLFARLDEGMFRIGYDKSRIGATIYIKLLSFNIYGGGQQLLSDVDAVSHTIAGPPVPETVASLQAQQNGNVVVFKWPKVSRDAALKGYDIAFAPQGETDWSKFVLLTEAARGTEMTNASVPPGTWTFGIRARDIADQLSEVITTVDLTVTNANAVILDAPQQPAWLGDDPSAFGFVRHYTGKLVPESIFPANNWDRIAAPGAPVLSQTPGGSAAQTTYYVKISWVTGNAGTSADAETTAGTEGSITVDADNLLVVEQNTGAPTEAAAFNVYASTSSGTEKKQNDQPIPRGVAWTMPATGLISGASPPTINSTGWEVLDLFVPFPFPLANYYTPEYDTGFDDILRVWLSGITQTQATFHVWNSSGSDVGGAINYSASGE